MTLNRVQKLLFSEYCDFEDMVLIESPFAQTTKDGLGIRQVHLGLTPSKLVLATDILPPAEYVNVNYAPGLDPEIETFELIAIYPVECVSLSVYRKKKKQALKARFCNNKVLYFELGGFERRTMFWNLWCERVKFLCPGHSSSSRSETSVATSSTGSTLYLLNKRMVSVDGATKQIWCRFGSSSLIGGDMRDMENRLVKKWTDKNLYLGKSFEGVLNFKPTLTPIKTSDFVKEKQLVKPKKNHRTARATATYMEEKCLNYGDNVQVNRFGDGVDEGCGNPLYLTADDYLIPKRYSTLIKELTFKHQQHPSDDSVLNFNQLAESAVLQWEFYKLNDPNRYSVRHRRRYGLTTCSFVLYGFNPTVPLKGSKYSLQINRVCSELNLSRKPAESELVVPVDKRLLRSSLSYQYLSTVRQCQPSDIFSSPKKPVEYFWTTNYEYQPKSSKESYDDFRKQLQKIKQLRAKKVNGRKRNKKMFKKFTSTQTKSLKESDEDSTGEPYCKRTRRKKHGFIYNMFSGKMGVIAAGDKSPEETSLQSLKRVLHVDLEMSAWDFDSTKLAEQLTMLERDLFLKIPTSELELMLWQNTSENAPNVCALIAFSHRISCLISSEILKNNTEKSRARLIARFINTAYKCHRISNFQSCKTIISGLQSPAIYRLRRTWAYLRKKHATKYQSFEILCRLYRDPRLPNYQKTYYILSQYPPFLPHISDVISRLFGKVPEYGPQLFSRSLSRIPSVETSKSSMLTNADNYNKPFSIINKIYRVFKGGGGGDMSPRQKESRRKTTKKSRSRSVARRNSIKFKSLYEYYGELDYNFCDRCKDLEETKNFLEKSQLGAVSYNFKVDELTKSYLLKARYGENKKNFYKSFSVESPGSYYEKISK